MRALLAVLLLVVAAGAHDFWIRPERFAVEVEAPLPVRLFVGEHGVGEAVLRDDSRLLRFELLDADGARAVLGRNGADPAGLVRVRRSGPQWLVFANTPKPIELDAEKFEEYLVEQGLDAIAARRKERGETGRPAKEIYSRCAKSLLRAGPPAEADEALVLAPVGLRLELVPLADPTRLRPGAEGADLALRVLFEQAPLANVLVKATLLHEPPPLGAEALEAPAPHAHDEATPGLSARSDAEGRVTLRLPRGGAWLVCAEHMLVAQGEASKAHDYESVWASLSFEVPER